MKTPPREPEPEHIHWCPEFFDRKAGPFAHHGMPAIGADGQVGTNFQRSFSRIDGEPGNVIPVPDEIRHLCAHAELKRRIAFPLIDQETEEVPLWHEGDI